MVVVVVVLLSNGYVFFLKTSKTYDWLPKRQKEQKERETERKISQSVSQLAGRLTQRLSLQLKSIGFAADHREHLLT